MSHPLQIEFEKKLNSLAVACDNYLEDNYGNLYPIHPNRSKRGQASSGLYDGLFATFFKFSTGYGSKYGRGYIITIEIRTLDFVSKEDKYNIINSANQFIENNMHNHLGDRDLQVVKDGILYKLIGDFSLN